MNETTRNTSIINTLAGLEQPLTENQKKKLERELIRAGLIKRATKCVQNEPRQARERINNGKDG